MSKPEHFRVQINNSKTKGKAKSRQPLAVPSEPMSPSRETELSPAKDADRLKRCYTYEYRMAQQSQTGKESNYTPSRFFDEQGVWRKGAEMLRAKGIDPVKYMLVLFRGLRSTHFFVDTGEANSRARQKRAARDIVAESKRQQHDVKDKNNIYVGLDVWADSRPPTPAQIFSPKYQEMFEHDMEKGTEVAALERKLAINYIKQQICIKKNLYNKSDQQAYESVLLNLGLPVGPLTRCIVAMNLMKVPETSEEEKQLNESLLDIIKIFQQSAWVQFMHNREGYQNAWGNLLREVLVFDAERFYHFLLDCLEFKSCSS
jgi:hypothetical protein